MTKPDKLLVFVFLVFMLEGTALAQKFRHPGIDMTTEDLAYVKSQVLAWNQPWKDAFEKMKASSDPDAAVTPFAHVLRGPYGKPDIGGAELRKSARLAYDMALIWYISGDKAYARKAIGILNGWSGVLAGFDYNDAKLLAGWTGHELCNAAEILRHTGSGWNSREIDAFTGMLQKVYLPLLRFYYPQANGNWDASIIRSLLAIAVFTDNAALFNNAVDHFLHAPFNGSLFKYIYPDGQCQESTRDQAHVQLGLGEYAGAARIAFSQGVDLFSVGDNRLALGFEYTARVVMGEKPHCYGTLSEKALEIRDCYEHVYRHYKSAGITLPYTGRAADSARSESTRTILTASRAPVSHQVLANNTVKASAIAFPAGALSSTAILPAEDAIIVLPGESVQLAIDSAAGKGKTVLLKTGVHTLPHTLKIPSELTLAGEGLGSILFLDPASGERDAVSNAEPQLKSVIIRNLVIEGSSSKTQASDPNTTRSFRSTAHRGGIILRGNKPGDLSDVQLVNVTVRNCTFNGVEIDGAKRVRINNCDFSENGSSVVPGPRLQHNLLVKRSDDVIISNSRLSGSPFGCGTALSSCSQCQITGCEIARNGWHGVLLSESVAITVSGCLIEAADGSGIMAEFLFGGCENVNIEGNQIQYNEGFGIEAYATKKLIQTGNRIEGNGTSEVQVKISDLKEILME